MKDKVMEILDECYNGHHGYFLFEKASNKLVSLFEAMNKGQAVQGSDTTQAEKSDNADNKK